MSISKKLTVLVPVFIIGTLFSTSAYAQDAMVQVSTDSTAPSAMMKDTSMMAKGSMMKMEKMKMGSRSKDVEWLQDHLVENGFLNLGTAKKGYFGAKTKTALKKYQKSIGVKATGVYDTATSDKVNSLMSADDSKMMMDKKMMTQ